MRKALILLPVLMLILGCSLFTSPQNTSTESNTCYSEQNLTEEECENNGNHSYSSSGSTEGFGGFDCGFDDGSAYFAETTNVTFRFSGNGSLVLDHPGEEVWGETSHIFERVSENIFEYSGTLENGTTLWTITFAWWGYQEELVLSYDCDGVVCGCRATFENRLQ